MIMKKISSLLVLMLVLSISAVKADNDKIISKDQLPAQAQKFLYENFANVKCSYVKLERDFLERSYEVMLADGTKIEFTGKGLWEEVDSRYGEVPEGIIPEPIRHYINENYSGSKVLRIERNRYGFEVKLSNKLELTFSKEFQLIDIDD